MRFSILGMLLGIFLLNIAASRGLFVKNDRTTNPIKQQCRSSSKVKPNMATRVEQGNFDDPEVAHDRYTNAYLQCILDKSNATKPEPDVERLRVVFELAGNVNENDAKRSGDHARAKSDAALDFGRCLIAAGKNKDNGKKISDEKPAVNSDPKVSNDDSKASGKPEANSDSKVSNNESKKETPAENAKGNSTVTNDGSKAVGNTMDPTNSSDKDKEISETPSSNKTTESQTDSSTKETVISDPALLAQQSEDGQTNATGMYDVNNSAHLNGTNGSADLRTAENDKMDAKQNNQEEAKTTTKRETNDKLLKGENGNNSEDKLNTNGKMMIPT